MLIKKDEIPRIFGRSAAAFLIFAAFAGCTAIPDLPRRYMISAANPLASEAGRKIMRQGGGAVDAAIAAQAVLTLVEPQSSGIGGGGFLLHFRQSDGLIDSYDGRETAPAAIRPRPVPATFRASRFRAR